MSAPVDRRPARRGLNPGLTLLSRMSLYAVAALSLASTLATLREMAAFDRLVRVGRLQEAAGLADAERLSDGFVMLAFWIGIASGAITILWWFRAYLTIEGSGAPKLRWSHRWAVGGWFIPLGNMVIPKLVLNEIDRVSKTPGDDIADWRATPLEFLPHWWWGFWVTGLVATFAGTTVTNSVLVAPVFEASRYRMGLQMTVFGFGASMLAGFLGAASIRVLGDRLHH